MAESNTTESPKLIRPRSGTRRPATKLTSVVLPEPDGPNRAVARVFVSKQAASEKPPRRFATSTVSMIIPRGSACRHGAPAIPRPQEPVARSRARQGPGGLQPDRAHDQRKSHDAAGERRAGPAERKHDAKMIGQKGADRPAPAEGDQQQISGHDRR